MAYHAPPLTGQETDRLTDARLVERPGAIRRAVIHRRKKRRSVFLACLLLATTLLYLMIW